ncbi:MULTISPECIES: YciI family protein [unclassified Stenotrophomonas]|uniref:YciI family protein n=1 Tax=unclassified Stenotrophomonas TaxID=196198 RepID=UPI0021180C77|nr:MULTISPECIES: YciI family protein [unclassified Stenotrophomonas]
MKVMVFVKATPATEAGQMPTEAEIRAMGAFNEALVQAGIMLAGEGLHPTSRARRVAFGEAAPRVIDGPFAETGELVCGYWLWQVRSLDEATEWLTRAPFGPGAVVELRPVFGPEDFGAAFTPELQAQAQRLRDRLDSGH